jgi:hypothetical protein
MLSCGTRIHSLQKLRNTAPKSQISPKTSPITIETRKNSSGSKSIAKKDEFAWTFGLWLSSFHHSAPSPIE